MDEMTTISFTTSQRLYLPCKRALDLVVSFAALLLLACPMLVLSAAIKISSPRQPVLFRQKRVGRYEKSFTLWKFRSMDTEGKHISPLGKFLRNSSLDELPQLFQILTGSMSLVGPRPLIPDETDIQPLRRKAGVYALRPGLTGLAQIRGRDKLDIHQKAAYDQEYLKRFSLFLDCKILLITIGKVLLRSDIRETEEKT